MADSEEEDSAEDYAENLSLSKNTEADSSVPPDYKGSPGGGDPATTSASSSQADYYGGFPLGLAHAQLNPHGLVYMTSPYLQGTFYKQLLLYVNSTTSSSSTTSTTSSTTTTIANKKETFDNYSLKLKLKRKKKNSRNN